MTTTRYVVLLAGAAAVLVGPLGYRAGLLPLLAALGLLAVGLLLVLGGLAVSVVGLLRGGWAQLDVRAAAVLVLAAGVSAVPLISVAGGIRAPPIHDITTDTDDPPTFDAVVALRADAPNPLDYRGPELAAVQRGAYPDLQPLALAGRPAEIADLAVAAAEELGWEVVAVSAYGPQPGADRYRGVLIEATDTTFWFGFRDDVAMRLRTLADAEGAGTTVDVRSISRVGQGDLGANAARIRRFLDRLSAAAG